MIERRERKEEREKERERERTNEKNTKKKRERESEKERKRGSCSRKVITSDCACGRFHGGKLVLYSGGRFYISDEISRCDSFSSQFKNE